MRAVVAASGALAGLAAGQSSPRPPPPTIYNLGTLPGGESSYGYAVNWGGQVAGHSTALGVSRAFRYDGVPGAGGVMRELGTLGGAESLGCGVNALGQVTGYSVTAGNVMRAFRYDGMPGAGGVMRDLGTFGVSGGGQSIGAAINSHGQVAGYGTEGQVFHAFRYDGSPGAGGIMRDLGSLGGWATASYAFAINDAGQVAGWCNLASPSGLARAFRYDGVPGAGGVMLNLGTFGYPGTSSYATAINAAGQVAGYATTVGDQFHHAFRYDGTPGAGGVMRDLGTLGGQHSMAFAINAGGQVAGRSERADGVWAAFLYVGRPGKGGVMHDLEAWLDAGNPGAGAKWMLRIVNGLSDNGWATGYGEYNDGVVSGGRAFLLDVGGLISPCYPNCDLSSTAPVLNILDFLCFLNRYVANDPYANCDGSTVAPVLNAGDLQCFLSAYAAGCS